MLMAWSFGAYLDYLDSDRVRCTCQAGFSKFWVGRGQIEKNMKFVPPVLLSENSVKCE